MVRSRVVLVTVLGLLCALGYGAYWLTTGSSNATVETSVSVGEAMTQDTSGFQRADTPRAFVFPDDHGPHPGYKNEWWYVTGNLKSSEGNRYGYELTIFRSALAPPSRAASAGQRPEGNSSWRTNQFYMAHFAVTDATKETFQAIERFSRGGAGLAGAESAPFRVWLEDWSLSAPDTDSIFPLRLRANAQDTAIDVTLRPQKPLVLQGDQGLIRKGPGSGNASYYYSYTRLATDGDIVSGGDSTAVSGQSWLDREWSTSALGPQQEGWDWFALQLEDGRDLMYYQLRNRNGSASRFSEGILVRPDGSTEPIRPTGVSLSVLDRWTSPDGTHTYPIKWRLRVPAHNLDVKIVPLLKNQELDVSVRYWEGAVQVEGSATGHGYVEMTGYGDSRSAPAL